MGVLDAGRVLAEAVLAAPLLGGTTMMKDVCTQPIGAICCMSSRSLSQRRDLRPRADTIEPAVLWRML